MPTAPNVLESVSDELDALIDAYKVKLKDNFLLVAKELLTNYCDFILVTGYTPGFNDGEPCEHSSSALCDIRSIYEEEVIGEDAYNGADSMFTNAGMERLVDIGAEIREEIGYIGHYKPTDEDRENLAKAEHKSGLSGYRYQIEDSKSKVAQRALDKVILPYCDTTWGTNFRVLIWMDNGDVKFEHEDYDCGH